MDKSILCKASEVHVGYVLKNVVQVMKQFNKEECVVCVHDFNQSRIN